MVKKNNKGITLDELANMVAGGFENTATKQDVQDVNRRIDGLEKKVNKLDFQVDQVYDILKRFEEQDILDLQKRVQILEKAVRALATSQSSK